MLLALGGVLAGILLGTRFRVLILIPTTILAWIGVAVFGFILHAGFPLTAAAMLMIGAALQFGFLIGIAIDSVTGTARGAFGARAPRNCGTPQLPAAP